MALGFLVVAACGAEAPRRDELRAALADLTSNIENVDDAGFQKAGRIMTNALSGTPSARLSYAEDCQVWVAGPGSNSGGPAGGLLQTATADGLLRVAFTAGVVQERIYGDTRLALYRGWLNVAKYYQHYHGAGTMDKINAVEKLIKQEKAGTLLVESQKVQARHPEAFDHLEIDLRGRDLAKEYSWEGCGTITLPSPENWSVVGKQYVTEGVYSFLITPKSGGRAEMTLSLLQHAKDNSGNTEAQTAMLERVMKPLADYSTERKIITDPMKMEQGTGLIGQLSGDTLIGRPPLQPKHRILRVAVGALDDQCTFLATMQADTVDGPEIAAMTAMVAGTVLRRSGPSAFLEEALENGNYLLTVPISKLRLTMPAGGLVKGPEGPLGTEKNKRYFYFIDAARKLQVSGWFEPASSYKGLNDFWKNENMHNRLGAEQVAFEKSDGWELIFYETPVSEIQATGKQAAKLTSTNMRAEYTNSGTWIDLHCSIVAPSPGKGSRAVLRAFLHGLRVDEK